MTKFKKTYLPTLFLKAMLGPIKKISCFSSLYFFNMGREGGFYFYFLLLGKSGLRWSVCIIIANFNLPLGNGTNVLPLTQKQLFPPF